MIPMGKSVEALSGCGLFLSMFNDSEEAEYIAWVEEVAAQERLAQVELEEQAREKYLAALALINGEVFA